MTDDGREVWRLCKRHPAYLISSHGRVRRIGRRILKPYPSTRGYLYVDLGKQLRGQPVHQLVAELFVGDRRPGCEPDHIDRDRTNNRADNLRWWHRTVNAVRWNGYDAGAGRIRWQLTEDEDPPEGHEPMSAEERAEVERTLDEWKADEQRARALLADAGLTA